MLTERAVSSLVERWRATRSAYFVPRPTLFRVGPSVQSRPSLTPTHQLHSPGMRGHTKHQSLFVFPEGRYFPKIPSTIGHASNKYLISQTQIHGRIIRAQSLLHFPVRSKNLPLRHYFKNNSPTSIASQFKFFNLQQNWRTLQFHPSS